MDLLDYLVFAALGAVLVVLVLGVASFGKPRSNKMMRLRILTQAIAVVLVVAVVWWRSQG